MLGNEDTVKVLTEDGSAKSMGSMLHPTGCTPCSFHCYSLMGCNKAEDCRYCHMDHPKRTRRRGKKKKTGGKDCQEMDKCGGKVSSQEQDDVDSQSGQADLQPQLLALKQLPPPEMITQGLAPLLSALEVLAPLPMINDAPETDRRNPRFIRDSEAPESFENASMDHFALAASAGFGGVSPASSSSAVVTRGKGKGLGSQVPFLRSETDPVSAGYGKAVEQRSTSLQIRELDDVLTLRYSEGTVVMYRKQWKQVLPFLGGVTAARAVEFSVEPDLPLGLSLNRTTGVISGIAYQPTSLAGIHCTVRVECDGDRATVILKIIVLAEWQEDFSGNTSLLNSMTVDSDEE